MAEDPLVIKGVDHRSRMYDKIAAVHKQIVEAKWRAQSVQGTAVQLKPEILLHLEEAITFLAEEMLRMTAMIESFPGDIVEAERKLLREETEEEVGK
ncbi:MAG: hypothetical protein V3V96_14405 [Acidiferrobacterales bacterium]